MVENRQVKRKTDTQGPLLDKKCFMSDCTKNSDYRTSPKRTSNNFRLILIAINMNINEIKTKYKKHEKMCLRNVCLGKQKKKITNSFRSLNKLIKLILYLTM